MELLFLLLMAWTTVFSAADEQAKLDAAKLELMLKSEAALYAEQADTVMKADVSLLPAVTYQGDAILVRTKSATEIKWLDKTYPLLPFDSGYFTYLPIPMDTKPGHYTIEGQTLQVKSKSFETDRLTVTKEQAAMKQDTKRIHADQVKINLARSKSDPTFASTDSFMIPVQGRLSTPYGYTRYVNGKYDGSHTAIDLAAPTGTEVHATNDGIIVLAEPLYLTGNSIYLDHGMNLFSQYAHLSKLLVKTGDIVKKGDVIGWVGTTGFSTGPHLHFTFWIGNKPVNPNLFFDTTPFQWGEK
ncbi:MAG: M23 family metallopeptidase [Paenibacillaceae bacterium]